MSSVSIAVGDEIEEGQVIGENGEEVYALHDSLCLEVTLTEEGLYNLKAYNYGLFSVSISLTINQYSDFRSLDVGDIYFEGNENDYGVEFLGYNYDYLESESRIIASFSPTNCKTFITQNTSIYVKVKTNEYLNQFYLPASIFDNNLCTKYFYVVSGSSYTRIYVEARHIIDRYALVTCSGYSLKEGLYIYQ